MSPYIVTASRPRPKHLIPETILVAFDVTFRRAVATLEERICFNSREWKRAGYDQPDGNLQFFHHVLILSRQHNGNSRRSGTAKVLWLHDGSTSSGHIVGCMDMPGEPTKADREKFPNWPERWGGRLIPESGGTVKLPGGMVVEVGSATYTALVERMKKTYQRLPWRPQDTAYLVAQASNGDEWAQGKILGAFNARKASAH